MRKSDVPLVSVGFKLQGSTVEELKWIAQVWKKLKGVPISMTTVLNVLVRDEAERLRDMLSREQQQE